MPQQYADWTLTVKGFDDDARLIEGLATTPAPDHAGDIMDPAGAQFTLPIPLLWQHDRQHPIGHVIAATIRDDGIWIRAQLAKCDEAGTLKAWLDEKYQQIKLKLVRGLSIGFKPLEPPLPLKGGGLHFRKWYWGELSAVTIPQNPQSYIAYVKSAAPGLVDLPRVGGSLTKAATPMIQEQIVTLENSRAASAARMVELMGAAAQSGETLDPTKREEYDELTDKVKGIDGDLVRLRDLEKITLASATPITSATTITKAGELRGGQPSYRVKSLLPKGTAFVRYCQAKAVSGGSMADALTFAKQWDDSTPEVSLMLKAVVNAGTTTDATWAGPLAQIKPAMDEFLELLRPQTILGRISGFVRVPFNTSVASQTGGGTYQWVGQGAPKPLTQLQFGSITLGITKCAGIVVITEELARLSTPSAEEKIRADMIAGIATFLDREFTDPAKAPVANVSPGSVTNGVTPLTTAGVTPAHARTDIQALLNAMVTAGIPATGAALLMSETNALALGLALNPLGQALFPGVGIGGGTVFGLQIITSSVVGSNVILVQPATILYADDGGVNIDVSREASVQMLDNPDNPVSATSVLTSLWQNNLVGLRAERFINWKRARNGGVQYVVATYTA